ncbi:Pimeloyl-ACP methyl ester carboxylesterase [Frankia canadensis]|uniref:Pimeloyl-ACP methyl ester carboxylesterase n=1 Tax=Frankia canadensis TaxID=1836972 RepID=A0A2I2KWP3_9ACTN|nr:alpha/beta hydrolase [Frankia canadensis]SNQ50079.1 Pimeloyl-ACP methyl ester carboxylesterase [Frankia canadensis]SOU57369.1 Pimeloyl-ACP methyl ester carboxylesterase [Frankia canadensis]
MTTSIAGFTYRRIAVGDVTLNVAIGGAGTPVLLLHGFPQTHLAWRHVAADLAANHLVVCPDLRGYGDSDKPADDAEHTVYSKRTMAADVVTLMRQLGHHRFAVAGHDRGAGVAFRAALDHPDAVSHLAVLGVIPYGDLWSTLSYQADAFLFHLHLMAHPAPFPEQVIASDPDLYFGYFLDTWITDPEAIPADVRAAYLAAARRPEAIAAVCGDYRSGAFVDGLHDLADRAQNRQLAMPVVAVVNDLGQTPPVFDFEAVWKSWAPRLRTVVLDGGHLLPEDRPGEVTAALRSLVTSP